MKTVGYILRTTRRSNNKKMIDIANEVGVSEAYISDIERNKRVPANDELMEKLAIAYEIERKTLFLQYGKLPSDVINEIAGNEYLASFLFEITKQGVTREEKIYHCDKLRMFL
ncbi:helix-turn-helix transcriptional regulator [Gottfriedia sp. S16(2024)]|uniref:helix-turn-helix domain-containing protein n=1 Tax=Gottfriedia sp. S16(2024) TaxID=3162883 RepID=UPI003D20CE15